MTIKRCFSGYFRNDRLILETVTETDWKPLVSGALTPEVSPAQSFKINFHRRFFCSSRKTTVLFVLSVQMEKNGRRRNTFPSPHHLNEKINNNNNYKKKR